jgi:transposase
VTKLKYIPEVDTIMMAKLFIEHAPVQEIESTLEMLFRYLDQLSTPEKAYVTGRPPVSRRVLLKSFVLKTVFQIPSLRKLVNFLKQFSYFRNLCGFTQVPHISTFSRTANWFRKEGFDVLHHQLLEIIGNRYSKLAFMDSTALRSSLYDSQARWSKSTRYKWYRGYKLHLCVSADGLILSYQFTTANVYDSVPAPSLLRSLPQKQVEMIVADKAYDSKKIREAANQTDVFFLSPINKRRSAKRKDSYGRIIPCFLSTSLGKWLMKQRTDIERQFNILKDKGLEQPRLFGFNRYLLHVQLSILIHNLEYLF